MSFVPEAYDLGGSLLQEAERLDPPAQPRRFRENPRPRQRLVPSGHHNAAPSGSVSLAASEPAGYVSFGTLGVVVVLVSLLVALLVYSTGTRDAIHSVNLRLQSMQDQMSTFNLITALLRGQTLGAFSPHAAP